MYVSVGGVGNFLSSVMLQQKFKVMDGPALQLSFFGKQRKIHPQGVKAGQKTQKEEEPPTQFWLLFLCFFSPPSGPVLRKLS